MLIGPCEPEYKPYLDQLTAMPRVRYLGSLSYADPLLVSAYAAAGVFCIASHSEVMPLCVLEALAAGTPAVMTRNHGMDTVGMSGSLLEVDPHSAPQIAQAVEAQFATSMSREACRSAVSHLTWEATARKLVAHYEKLSKGRAAAAAGTAVSGSRSA